MFDALYYVLGNVEIRSCSALRSLTVCGSWKPLAWRYVASRVKSKQHLKSTVASFNFSTPAFVLRVAPPSLKFAKAGDSWVDAKPIGEQARHTVSQCTLPRSLLPAAFIFTIDLAIGRCLTYIDLPCAQMTCHARIFDRKSIRSINNNQYFYSFKYIGKTNNKFITS